MWCLWCARSVLCVCGSVSARVLWCARVVGRSVGWPVSAIGCACVGGLFVSSPLWLCGFCVCGCSVWNGPLVCVCVCPCACARVSCVFGLLLVRVFVCVFGRLVGWSVALSRVLFVGVIGRLFACAPVRV